MQTDPSEIDKLIRSGDFAAALLAEAAALGADAENLILRYRAANLLRQLPILTQCLLHDGQVYSAVFSPDGRILVTACQDGAARLWDTATGEMLAIPLAH